MKEKQYHSYQIKTTCPKCDTDININSDVVQKWYHCGKEVVSIEQVKKAQIREG